MYSDLKRLCMPVFLLFPLNVVVIELSKPPYSLVPLFSLTWYVWKLAVLQDYFGE
jgi:hypothetical protein